jgi:hypothetical protein
MSILSRVVLDRAVDPADRAGAVDRGPGMPSNAGEVFAGYSSVSIGSASRRASGGARRVGMIGMAVLAAMALGADPDANAVPVPGCPQGPGPGPGPGCGGRAFLADIRAAGFRDSNGNLVALDQGLDMCGLMDAGLSRQSMVNQFWADNPTLGPDGAAQVVGIAVRDLCPWHS